MVCNRRVLGNSFHTLILSIAANDQSGAAEDTRRHMLARDPGCVHVSEFPNVVEAERHQRARMLCGIHLHVPKMLVI